MNRAGFMGQLDSLLSDIPAAEKEEAIQYYNDYFEDAGQENEEDVIRSLGSPSKVAENIKAELQGEKIRAQVQPGDHAVIRYGSQEETDAQAGKPWSHSPSGGDPQVAAADAQAGKPWSHSPSGGDPQAAAADAQAGKPWSHSPSGDDPQTAAAAQAGEPGVRSALEDELRAPWEQDAQEERDMAYPVPAEEKSGRGQTPTWSIALIVIGVFILVPAFVGLLSGLIGAFVGLLGVWFGLIAASAAVCAGMFVMSVVLTVVGALCLSASPITFMTLLGAAMFCAGLGLLALMLTTAMVGRATPAIFRGVKKLFIRIFGGVKRAVSGRR